MPAQTLVAGALARLGRAALTFARSIAVRLGLKPEAVRSRALAAGLLTVGTALSVSLLAALGPALAPHTVEAHPMEIAVAAPDLSSEIGAVSRLFPDSVPIHRNTTKYRQATQSSRFLQNSAFMTIKPATTYSLSSV